MSTKLTILAVPADVIGRVNACTGALRPFLNRGHRVVFALPQSWQGKLSQLGFEEHLFPAEHAPTTASTPTKPGAKVTSTMFTGRVIGPYQPAEKMRNLINLFMKSPNAGERIKKVDGQIKAAIQAISPDLIWLDNTYLSPAIGYSGIPWIYNISTTPLYCIYDETLQVPPGGSGFPSSSTDKNSWIEFNTIRREFFYSSSFNNYIEELGYTRYPDNIRVPTTALLTVYGYPKALNYPLIESKANWFNLECFNKNESQEVVDLDEICGSNFVADNLDSHWSGKWIYLSMGTMGSIDLDLMNRLVGVLARTKHKYIVSKGPRADELELEGFRNMWGDRYVNQKAILPAVQLVVTHGGNNTVAETLTQGKPLIVLPLFADQYDNAQRISECGLGLRLDPYNFEDQELIEAIDHLLADEQLTAKLSEISASIKANGEDQELVALVESRLSKSRSPLEGEAKQILSPSERVTIYEYQAIRQSGRPHLLFDVRSPGNRTITKLANAVELPLMEMETEEGIRKVESLVKKTFGFVSNDQQPKQIYTICGSGNSSQKAVQVLKRILKNDHVEIKDIIGGIKLWAKEIEPSLIN